MKQNNKYYLQIKSYVNDFFGLVFDNKIKEILDDHYELSKQINNSDIEKNLIIFNMPITFEQCRQSKSYIEQISSSTENELNNTDYNELYMSKLGVKITKDDVIFVKIYNLNICVYEEMIGQNTVIRRINKHFNWIDDTNQEIDQDTNLDLSTISNHVQNIVKLQDQINLIQDQIKDEKNKIIETKYVKSKLNKPIEKTNEYIKTIEYIQKKISRK